jgi:hypothetical protein
MSTMRLGIWGGIFGGMGMAVLLKVKRVCRAWPAA